MTGAIFCERRPATIIRSAWRGEGRKTSAPKRARSKRAAAMDIISIAQQARPKPSGHMELLRAQFTALSRVVKMMPSSARRFPKSSGFVSVTCLPSDVLIRSPSQVCSHRERLETNCPPTSRWDICYIKVSGQVGDGCLDGAVVQLFVRRRSSVLCARTKPRERMQQQGQKSLRPRRAIAKMAVSASGVYRCSLEKAKRHDPEPIRLDLRAAKALRFQRLQTLALPLPVIDLLPGLDSGCCRWRGS